MKSVNDLHNAWNALLPLPKIVEERINQKFIVAYNYNSNLLEGNGLTYMQTELFLMSGQTKGSAKLSDYVKASAHNNALKKIVSASKRKNYSLTEDFVKELYKTLTSGPAINEYAMDDGCLMDYMEHSFTVSYKRKNNAILTPEGHTIHFASVSDTPKLMSELVAWYNAESQAGKLHPIELAALLHYKFLCIHPFPDANGRIARLLVNFTLLKNDYPMIVIHCEDKDEYHRALAESNHVVGSTGIREAKANADDVSRLSELFTRLTINSFESCFKIVNGDDAVLYDELHRRISTLHKRLDVTINRDDVKLAYSKPAVKSVVERTIVPLLKTWEEYLSEFDLLIYNRKSYMSIDGYEQNYEYDFLSLADNLVHLDRIPEENIHLSLYITGIRNTNKNKNSKPIYGGEIRITFYKSVYEIRNSANETIYTKLYHQGLDEAETEEIMASQCETLANTIYEFIENDETKNITNIASGLIMSQ